MPDDIDLAKSFKEKGLSCEKLNKMIKEEEMASKEYSDLGMENISRDEANHAIKLKELKSKICLL